MADQDERASHARDGASDEVAPIGASALPVPDRTAGSGTAIVVMVVLAAVAASALVLGGWLLWRNLSDAEVSWGQSGPGDGGDSTEVEAVPAAELPTELTDETLLTALPGETFEGTYDTLVVGQDLAPGIYIAPSATPSTDEEWACDWWVTPYPGDAPTYESYGVLRHGSAMLLAPPGYVVSTSSACGTWEAIDPDGAFVGATAEVIEDGQHYVGRDVVSGTYLVEPSNGPIVCTVEVAEHFGFMGEDVLPEFLWMDTGSALIELEDGDRVEARDCDPLTLVDPQALVADGFGATTADEGEWLVGVDVAAGTWTGPDLDSEGDYCTAMVLERDADEVLASADYGWGETPDFVHVEPGQVLKVYGCDGWVRTGD
ncbi:hypothetical protein [Demequina sp. NBRC 110056]|uniref:hypothetical protein n=1 Tax=Demequina sp. NBRC 110056 TaxID=1570345 RepID=UPI000A0375FD|nr:hypothetical protein [Demequina sp. NBRC 110056]